MKSPPETRSLKGRWKVSSTPAPAAVWIVPLLVVAPLAASAEDVTVQGAATVEYIQNTDFDPSASAFDGRVELDIGIGAVTLGCVYRSHLLSEPTYNPAGRPLPDAELSQRYAEFTRDALTLRAGDCFATFGRGLALRSFEDVDLEYDTTLDGFLARYSFGAAALEAISGAATERVSRTGAIDHRIRGIHASVPVSGWLDVGGSVVERSATERDEVIVIPAESARFEESILTAEVGLRLGALEISGERAARDGRNPVTDDGAIDGRATYVAGSLSLPWLTLFGEYKDYWDFRHYLVSPPTCARDHAWTLPNRVTHEVALDDERGFLIEGSAPLGDGLYLTGGASEARNHAHDLRHWELYGELDHALSERVTGTLGASWSREYLFIGAEGVGKFDEHASAVVDLAIETAPGQLVELTGEGQRIEDPSGECFERYLVAFACYPTSFVTIVSAAEWTTDRFADRGAWLVTEVRFLPTPDSEIAVAVGSEPEGKKCSGGVCHFEPEFEGARLRLSTYF